MTKRNRAANKRSLSPIAKNPQIMGGTPCIRGTRIPVRNLVAIHREEGLTAVGIKKKHYPKLEVKDIKYALNWYRRAT